MQPRDGQDAFHVRRMGLAAAAAMGPDQLDLPIADPDVSPDAMAATSSQWRLLSVAPRVEQTAGECYTPRTGDGHHHAYPLDGAGVENHAIQ